MPLFKVIWNLPTDVALYKGAYVVIGDDAEHAIERAKSELGAEGQAATWRVEGVNGQCFELGRNAIPVDTAPNRPLPDLGKRTLFAFELAARANVIAASEQAAFSRFSKAVSARESDGKYCKLLRTAVLEKEEVTEMSRFERHTLEKSFRSVQGGAGRPK